MTNRTDPLQDAAHRLAAAGPYRRFTSRHTGPRAVARPRTRQ